jgi:hypothetical protein
MFQSRLFKFAVAAAALPISTIGAALRTPKVIRSHPRSRELRGLLHDGFDLESVRVGRRGAPTVVELDRGGERRSVRDADAAFAIYALSRLQRRRLSPRS